MQQPAPATLPPLRRQQSEALAALDAAWATGRTSGWVVLPPGGGKTRLGLEAIARLGRRAVVFGPNTAIQGQWVAQGSTMSMQCSTTTDLGASVTVLTYQALAVFTPDEQAEAEEATDGSAETAKPRQIDRLHPHALALIDRLATAGPLTLVLDECHHLVEVWGELLAEVLERLPDVRVVALTATPPEALSAEEAALVATLFGPVIYSASIPGFVRDGQLAPFRELVWFTEPTAGEADYLARTSQRFAQLRSDLMTPQLTSTPFLQWLDERFARRGAVTAESVALTPDGHTAISWKSIARQWPDLADAVLRAVHAGLLPLPSGAQLREQHRTPMDADDWILLIDDFVTGCLVPSTDVRDHEVLEAIRAAVPGVGYRLTRRGLVRGTAPADRVVARSASKADAVIAITDNELGVRGEGLRMLVLCDFERASAQVPEGLVGVIAAEEGSARGTLRRLVADSLVAGLSPVVVSGAAVACAPSVAPRLVTWLRAHSPGLDLDDVPSSADAERDAIVDITGRWSSRDWVPLLTRWLEDGNGQILIGTRSLLGEGWDARRVNVLVDLTSATTAMSVTQTRGRALRVDPLDPHKVAHNWTVVCVADGHPLGDRDYQRFVRKHHGFYAVTDDGLITDGVGHVSPHLSPYAPPADREAMNAQMCSEAADPEHTRALWHIGEPYADMPVVEIRVRVGRSLGINNLAAVSGKPMPRAISLGHGPDGSPTVRLRPRWWRSARSWLRGGAGLEALGEQSAIISAMAAAVAEGMSAAGLSSVGAAGVRVAPTDSGEYRIWIDGVDDSVSAVFASALDEVLSPLASPRYVVPRVVIPVPSDADARRRLAWAQLWRRPVRALVVWHAVPSALGARKELAEIFGAAWNRWVSPGGVVYTANPEGAGVLASQRGDDPFNVETATRTEWR